VTGARPRVLVVDDEPMNLELLERSLRRRYHVISALGPEQALQILAKEPTIAVILCDYRMPGMTGTEVLAEAIRFHPNAKRVIITGYADVDGVIDAINRGQVHYFVRKPWSRDDLDRTVDQLIQVQRLEDDNRRLLGELRHANEELRFQHKLLAENLDDRGNQLLQATAELERMNRELQTLAFRDELTGLYNQRAFMERLREEVARARRHDQCLSVILGDVDDLRLMNTRLGHATGDEMLQHLAELMRQGGAHASRESDVLARYGGDEFVLLLPETSKAGTRRKAERLLDEVRLATFPRDQHVSMSFGAATFPDDAATAEELLALADRALYAAKQRGGDQVQVVGEIELLDDFGPRRPAAPSLEAITHGGGWRSIGELPRYHECIAVVCAALERDRALGCIYIDLSQLRRVEFEYGISRFNELLSRATAALGELRESAFRRSDILCRLDDSDAFVCFLPGARRGSEGSELESLASHLQQHMMKAIEREVLDLLHDHPRMSVGHARVLFNPMARGERLVAKLVDDARDSAALVRKQQTQRDKALLQQIILDEQLTPVYQPIVHLDSGEVFGFEALTRGPRRSVLEAPMALFAVAEEVNLLFELDRACFRNALRGATGLEPVHRLFVNLLPMSFYDTSFIENEVAELLEAAHLTPSNIVFEITERLAIENFASFRRALTTYTNMGFGVAVDDVGTKHSNLEAVMALRPNFIKLSDVITRGVSKSTVKREMLRSLRRIAEAIDAVMVAEGIETPADLAVLKDLGVKYGQGYFLARPGAPFPRLKASVKRAVIALANSSQGGRAPTPAPPAIDFDEDGEVREPTMPPEELMAVGDGDEADETDNGDGGEGGEALEPDRPGATGSVPEVN
jgi:diguanylate cyclase (GGDEF)-like protein